MSITSSNGVLNVTCWQPYTAVNLDKVQIQGKRARIVINYHSTMGAVDHIRKAIIKVSHSNNNYLISINGYDKVGNLIIKQIRLQESKILTALKALQWPTIIQWAVDNRPETLLSIF